MTRNGAMASEALTGGFEDAPRQSARAFRAALEVMARPGEVQELGDLGAAPAPVSPAAATLLLVLCDPETPVHLAGDHDRPEVRDWITFHCGAPLVAPGEAAFGLGTWEALGDLGQYAIGTAEYPDRSATLIVDGAFAAQPVTLAGPGIKESRRAELPAVGPFRANRALFPLGLDFYFCDGATLWALPRTTRVAEGELA
ncbi:phosphonate C-P lyase system protein PhnH [Ferrimonas balearica]|nr:phosphonate C-P lyase system protein PhnH [Ferrimonas balearica]